jgi:hypothetical protein
VRRLPTYNISAAYLLRGLAAALLAGLAAGAVWGFFLPFNVSIFLGLLAGLGLGYAVGEAVSVAANRKAGPPLQAVAVIGVVVAYLVRCAILASAVRGVELGEILREDLFGYAVVIVGALSAIGRLR